MFNLYFDEAHEANLLQVIEHLQRNLVTYIKFLAKVNWRVNLNFWWIYGGFMTAIWGFR